MSDAPTILGQHVDRAEAARYGVGRDPFAGIRRLRFDGGPEGDMRLIEIRNAAGLVVELLPDRCLDIGAVWFRGVPFGWIGANGLPTERGPGGDFDVALGGLLATCGFDHIRAAVTLDGRHYPQHGTMALRRTVVETCGRDAADGGFTISARAEHGTLDGERYVLARRIRVAAAEPRLWLDDLVTYMGPDRSAPVMALYHVNLGYPQVGEGFACRVAGASRADIASMGDETRIERAPALPYGVEVGSRFGALSPTLEVRVEGGSLPFLQFHRRTRPGANLFCIEPVSHDRLPRAELVAAEPPMAAPFEARFSLSFCFSI